MAQETIQEIIFVVHESPKGGFEAQAVGYSIFTEADTLEGLRRQVQDAVQCPFPEESRAVHRDYFHEVVDGRPAAWDEPTILIGAAEHYEARCRNCHQVRRVPPAYRKRLLRGIRRAGETP